MAKILVGYGTKMGGTVAIAEKIGEVLSSQRARGHRHRGIQGPSEGWIRRCRHRQRPLRRDVARPRQATRQDGGEDGTRDCLSGCSTADRSARTRPTSRRSSPVGLKDLETGLDVRDKTTFGGLLTEDSPGMIAKSLRKNGMTGDFRDMDAIAAWADTIADAL